MRYFTLGLASALFASTSFSASALAADVPRAPAPLVPYTTPVVPAWTGFYIGGHLGWGGTSSESSGVAISDGSGFLGGVQGGFNYQFAPNWLIGLEADASWTGIEGDGPLSQDINWIATFGPRFGYVFGNGFIYAKGGVARAGVELRADPVLQAVGNSDTRAGWFVGVGVEHTIWYQLSAKIEYNYVDLGTSTVTALGAPPPGNLPFEVDQSAHLLKIGLDYKFPAAPFFSP
jgi:outer membrane immunogenic protein